MNFQKGRENSHFVMGALLAVALPPLLRVAGLPLHFDWMGYATTYWIGLAFFSICYAALLYLVAFPLRSTWQSVWRHYRRDKPLLFLLLAATASYLCFSRSLFGFVVLVDLFAALEMVKFAEERRIRFGETLAAILPPGIYLFLGLILLAGYNDLIASFRFYGAYDPMFNRMDAWLMGGLTVSQLVHGALSVLPLLLFKSLDVVYFWMLPQLGAALLFLSLATGRKRALQFVGTLLVAYYFALLLFFLWPAQGPFYLCAGHFTKFPSELVSYHVQRDLLLGVDLVWRHQKTIIGRDYFIAFPSMHVAAPLVVLWFLRRWKRLLWFLIAVDTLLLASIVLLEWHYVVDLIGGVGVAAAAIALVVGRDRGEAAAAGSEIG